MNTAAAHMIGVMRLPSLAAALTAAGYTVITADDYKATATNIRAAFDEHGPFPIFVADSKWPGLRAWATRFAGEEGVDVILVRTANGDGIDFGDGTVIEAHVPMSVAELLALATRAVHPSFADYKVDENGRVDGFVGDFDEQPVTPAPAPAAPAFVAPPVTEPVFEQPVSDAAEPQPEPAYLDPEVAVFTAPPVDAVEAPAAPAAVESDDPWGDNTDAAPPFSTPQEPVFTAPAVDETPTSPVADPVFTTPATGETYPAEEPVAPAAPADDPWEDEATVAPAAPVATAPADDPWEEQAPAAPAAAEQPVFTAPAVEEPTEVVYDEPGTGEPVFTAPPVEQPAVVFEAPPVQADPLNDAWGEEPAAAEQPVFTAPPVQEPSFEAPVEHDPFQGEIAPQAPAGYSDHEPAAPVFTAPPAVEPPVFTAPPVQEPAQPVAPVVEQTYEQPTYEAPAAPVEPVEDVYAALAAQQHAESAPTNDPYIQTPNGELVPVSHSGHLPSGGDRPLGQVVISWAAKGGTGKTSTSVSLAQYAAKQGLRVILIDGNFGQGDIRTYLRIGMASLPSVYNYAITNDITQTLISPPTLSEARDLKQEPLRFGLITAPPAHMTDESVVTPEVYMRLVADARAMADLVVVDTQIVESKDSSGMVDRFMMPLLASGAWGLCSADISSAGVTNTLTRLKKMAAHGVPRERQLSFLNRVPNNLTFHREGLVATISEHSVFLGFCYADTAIPETQNSGGLPVEVPQFAEFMGAALGNVFPDLTIASQTQEAQGQTERKRRRLFGGRR